MFRVTLDLMTRLKVLADVDTGIDDSLALVYLGSRTRTTQLRNRYRKQVGLKGRKVSSGGISTGSLS